MSTAVEKMQTAAAECGESAKQVKAERAAVEQLRAEIDEIVIVQNQAARQLLQAVDDLKKLDLVKKSDFEQYKKITSSALVKIEGGQNEKDGEKSLTTVDYALVGVLAVGCSLVVSLIVGAVL